MVLDIHLSYHKNGDKERSLYGRDNRPERLWPGKIRGSPVVSPLWGCRSPVRGNGSH